MVFPFCLAMVRGFDIPLAWEGVAAGGLAAGYSAGQVLSGKLWGKVSDRIGRKIVIVGGLAAAAPRAGDVALGELERPRSPHGRLRSSQRCGARTPEAKKTTVEGSGAEKTVGSCGSLRAAALRNTAAAAARHDRSGADAGSVGVVDVRRAASSRGAIARSKR